MGPSHTNSSILFNIGVKGYILHIYFLLFSKSMNEMSHFLKIKIENLKTNSIKVNTLLQPCLTAEKGKAEIWEF